MVACATSTNEHLNKHILPFSLRVFGRYLGTALTPLPPPLSLSCEEEFECANDVR